MADATTKSAKLFNDPTAWDRIEEDVPIFVEHDCYRRKKQDGKFEIAVVPYGGPAPDGKDWQFLYSVDSKALHAIAEGINRQWDEDGCAMKLFEGHTDQSKLFKQDEQPRLLGYGIGAKVGKWGPKGKLAVIQKKQFIRKGCGKIVSELPERSPEFHPKTGEMRALALLKTDPRLNMGMVISNQRLDGVVCYSQGVDYMANPTKMPPSADELKQKGDAPDEEELDEDTKKNFMKYAKACLPKAYAMEQGGAPVSAPAPGMKVPGENNGAPAMKLPGQGDEDEDTVQHHKESTEDFDVRMSKIRMANLEKEQKAMKSRLDQKDCEARIESLVKQHYCISNPKREVQYMMTLDDSGRDTHVAYIKANFIRDVPGGGGDFIETEHGEPVNYEPVDIDPNDTNAIVAYAEQNNLNLENMEHWRKAQEEIEKQKILARRGRR